MRRAEMRERKYREAAKKAQKNLRFAAQAQADVQTEAELRAQAKQVVAWSWNVSVDLMQDDGYHEDARNGAGLVGQGGTVPVAVIRNDSAAPITEVEVRWCGTGEQRNTVVATRLISLIPPHDDAYFRRPDDIAAAQGDHLPIELNFIDASGMAWHRDQRGRLENRFPLAE